MHIGLAAPALPASGVPNGVVTYVRIMRDALRALGHRVSVVAGGDVETPDGEVRTVAPERRPLDRLRYRMDRLRRDAGAGRSGSRIVAAQMLTAHRLLGFDVLEMEEAFGHAGWLAAVASFPVIARLHGPHVFGRDPIEPPAIRRRSETRIAREGAALRRVAAVTSPSARLMAATLAHYDLDPAVAAIIPNPIAAAPQEECWSIDRCDPKQLLCVGRFDLRKGADIVVDAFARAAAIDPALRLVFAGPDTGIRQDDGTVLHHADYLRRNVAPEVAARIRFAGPVDAAEVQRLRIASAVTLVGSRFENFAYSIAEGMAIGAPAIVSDSFGNAEMVQDGVSGLVVPVGDAAAMARAILATTSDATRLAQMGRRSWKRCRDWLSPQRIAADTVALYDKVMA